ncbi:MAG: D-alanyl-D-alanine carboxypeptidase [Novosphingobium sp.]|nr:D-alanyl-D-alanine carboxypeptidase [Novosphingobium sp.]
MLVDLGSGQVLEARDVDRSFPPASMTKVMTAYVALEEMARGKLKPDRMFVVPEAIASEWKGKGTSLFLSAGDKITADELLHGITTVSANDASVVLATGYAGSVDAWSFLMNDTARRLGMTHTRYNTPNGWPDEGRTYVSASDLVKLAAALIRRHPDGYAEYFGKKRLTWNGRTQENHDPTVGIVDGADGIKTGYTREAGYNFLGSAKRDGRRLVLVIGGARSARQRAEAARALFEWGFGEWKARPLFKKGAIVTTARVQGGASRDVPVFASTPVYAAIPVDESEPLSLRLQYKGPVVAPVRKGAKIAELEIRVGDMPRSRIPLYAASEVAKANLFQRLAAGLSDLFT